MIPQQSDETLKQIAKPTLKKISWIAECCWDSESCFKIWMINTIDILMLTLKFILGRKFWTRENKLWSEATLSASLTITFAIECDLSFPNIEAGILKFIAIKKKPSFQQVFGSQSKKTFESK